MKHVSPFFVHDGPCGGHVLVFRDMKGLSLFAGWINEVARMARRGDLGEAPYLADMSARWSAEDAGVDVETFRVWLQEHKLLVRESIAQITAENATEGPTP